MSRPVIDYLTWNVTKACNFRCKYCYFPPEDAPGTTGLPVQKITEFLDGTGREWVIGLTGGEPFILPDFVELCRGLSKNHRLEIDTNLSLGRRIREFAETIDPDRVKDLYVALHIEERERRNGVREFVENVRLLMEKGFHVSVNYVIHPTLIRRYPADREYFLERGIRILPRPFKGVYEGVVFPAGYSAEAKSLFRSKPTAGRKMVYNFLSVPCHAREPPDPGRTRRNRVPVLRGQGRSWATCTRRLPCTMGRGPVGSPGAPASGPTTWC